MARTSRFANLYPRLKRGALIIGIIVPAILAVTFSLTTSSMVVALSAWVIWVLVIIAFLMAIEMMRDSMLREVRLGALSEETIRGIVLEYDKPRHRRFYKHETRAQKAPSVSERHEATKASTTNAADGEDAITIRMAPPTANPPTTPPTEPDEPTGQPDIHNPHPREGEQA